MMKRAATATASGFQLLIGPMNLVVVGVAFHAALMPVAVAQVVMPEAAYIQRPEIERGLALQDPLSHRPAGAAGGGNTGCEAASDIVIIQLRCQPHNRLAIWRNGNGAVDHSADAELIKDGQPPGGEDDDLLEAAKINLKQLPLKLNGQEAVLAADLGTLFPTTEHEGTGLRLAVEEVIRVAEGRQIVGNTTCLFGHQILMLDDAGRDANTGHIPDLAGPQTGCVDNDLTVDGAVIGHHVGGSILIDHNVLDQYAFTESRTTLPGPFGIGVGKAVRVHVAISGNERGPDHAFHAHQRKQLLGLFGRNQMHFEPDALGKRGGALYLLPARLTRRDPQATDLLEACRLSAIGLDGLTELDAVLHHPGQVTLAPELAYQARGVPGTAVGKAALLEQHHVALAGLR